MITPHNIFKKLSPKGQKEVKKIEGRLKKLDKEIEEVDKKLAHLNRKDESRAAGSGLFR